MHVRVWCETNSTSLVALAKRADLSQQALQRYAAGERTPRPEPMRRIFLATNGRVGPEDWYSLEAWRAELAVRESEPAANYNWEPAA